MTDPDPYGEALRRGTESAVDWGTRAGGVREKDGLEATALPDEYPERRDPVAGRVGVVKPLSERSRRGVEVRAPLAERDKATRDEDARNVGSEEPLVARDDRPRAIDGARNESLRALLLERVTAVAARCLDRTPELTVDARREPLTRLRVVADLEACRDDRETDRLDFILGADRLDFILGADRLDFTRAADRLDFTRAVDRLDRARFDGPADASGPAADKATTIVVATTSRKPVLSLIRHPLSAANPNYSH